MSDTHPPPSLHEMRAAFGLGYNRFMLRGWQELEWTWFLRYPELHEEEVHGCVDACLKRLSQCRWELVGRLQSELSSEVNHWIDDFGKQWTDYYGSQEHLETIAGRGEGIEPHLRKFNPFNQQLGDLLRITNHRALFAADEADIWRWFRIGSAIGQCDYFAEAFATHSAEFRQALDELGQIPGLPNPLRVIVERIQAGAGTLAPAALLPQLLREAQAALGDPRNPLERQLVVVEQPPEVYYHGTRIRGLKPFEHRMIKAFAERPGGRLARQQLLNLIGSDTSEKNLQMYLSNTLKTIARSCSTREKYEDLRKQLKAEVFATDKDTGEWFLNLPPEQVAIVVSLPLRPTTSQA